MQNKDWRPAPGKPRPAERIPVILKAIGKVWARNPDMRFCQLIGNILPHDVLHVGESYGNVSVYHTLDMQKEDDTLLDWIEQFQTKGN